MFRARELLDGTLSVVKNALCSQIVDPDRLLLGTEEGLYCLELDRSGKFILLFVLYNFVITVIFLHRNCSYW